jgi:hypothetical protein
MPDFRTEIEVEPWEYVSSCNRNEIDELIETLIDDGHLVQFNGKVVPKKEGISIMDMDWADVITKLKNSKHLLSVEEENTIIKIANKLN